MASESFGVFVSGVASEFEQARTLVVSDLRSKRIETRLQEDFNQGEDKSTLERLHTYISGCETVIGLVGRRSGAMPPPRAMMRFEEILPEQFDQLSYTQWEIVFALSLDKKLLLYEASSEYQPDRPEPVTDDDAELQADFTAWLWGLGRNRRVFSTHDELRRQVLLEPWEPGVPTQEEARRVPLEKNEQPQGSPKASTEQTGRPDANDPPRPKADADLGSPAAEPLSSAGDTRLVHDHRAAVDELGRANLAIDVAERIAELSRDGDSPGAFAVHLDGRWGEGKSSLVGFIADHLRDPDETKPPWTIIEMDAWRSSQMSPAWWALLTHLREGVRKSKTGTARHVFRARFLARETWRLKRFWIPSVLVLALSLGLIALGVDVIGTLGAITSIVALTAGLGGFLTGFLGLGTMQGARLHERTNDNPMTEVVEQFNWFRRQSDRPILLILDDLDRCNETFAVKVLDAVQTLLRTPASDLEADRTPPQRIGSDGGSPGRASAASSSPSTSEAGSKPRRHRFRRRQPQPPQTLVVIALGDQRWLRAAYEHAYSVFSPFVSEPGRPLGHLFLNKLFQVRIEMPRLSGDQFGAYLRHILDVEPAAGDEARLIAERAEQIRNATKPNQQQGNVDDDVMSPITATDNLSAKGKQELVGIGLKQRRDDPNRAKREHHLLQNYADLLDPNPRSAKRFVMAYNLAYAARLSELTPFSTDTLALWTVVNIRWPDLAEWIRTRIAEGTIEPSDDELRDIAHPCHLLQRSEVLAVFGSKRGGPLNAATLVRYCGHVPPSEAGGTIGADTENPPTAVPVAQAAGIIVPGEILREETNPAGSLRAVIDDGVVGTG